LQVLENMFSNNYAPPGGKSFKELVRWMYQRWRLRKVKKPEFLMPMVKPDIAWLKANQDKTSVTWINHATLLLQVGGKNILTDPVFSDRVSPVTFFGPKRKAPLPLSLEELPHIDFVVISHNHYDHLDYHTVKALQLQPGGSPLFLVPLGIDLWMQKQGINNVRAFNWWDMQIFDNIEFYFVPAQHWSARTHWDRNETLWGGWVVKMPHFSFYYTGDTGYSKDFKDIAARFGGFDFAAIPVGCYEPRWFMKEQHVNPAEAVQIHIDVCSKLSLGIHWGTFALTDEPLGQPQEDLRKALKQANISEEEFVLFKQGEMRVFD